MGSYMSLFSKRLDEFLVVLKTHSSISIPVCKSYHLLCIRVTYPLSKRQQHSLNTLLFTATPPPPLTSIQTTISAKRALVCVTRELSRTKIFVGGLRGFEGVHVAMIVLWVQLLGSIFQFFNGLENAKL